MACHLAGVPTAVATCGTAFGADHIRIVRRLLGDDSDARRRGGVHLRRGRGRAEGRDAGLRGGPAVRGADLRRGRPGRDGPVRAAAWPGRRGGARAGGRPPADVPVRASARRSPGSTSTPSRAGSRRCARRRRSWRGSGTPRCAPSTPAGWPAGSGWRSTRSRGPSAGRALAAGRGRDRRGAGPAGGPGGQGGRGWRRTARAGSGAGWGGRAGATGGAAPAAHRPDPRDPVARVEREALECMLQVPQLVPRRGRRCARRERLRGAGLPGRAPRGARRRRDGARPGELSPQAWAEAVSEAAPQTVASLVTELASPRCPPTPTTRSPGTLPSVVLRVAEVEVTREIGTCAAACSGWSPTTRLPAGVRRPARRRGRRAPCASGSPAADLRAPAATQCGPPRGDAGQDARSAVGCPGGPTAVTPVSACAHGHGGSAGPRTCPTSPLAVLGIDARERVLAWAALAGGGWWPRPSSGLRALTRAAGWYARPWIGRRPCRLGGRGPDAGGLVGRLPAAAAARDSRTPSAARGRARARAVLGRADPAGRAAGRPPGAGGGAQDAGGALSTRPARPGASG